jgi:hypothetical protein
MNYVIVTLSHKKWWSKASMTGYSTFFNLVVVYNFIVKMNAEDYIYFYLKRGEFLAKFSQVGCEEKFCLGIYLFSYPSIYKRYDNVRWI